MFCKNSTKKLKKNLIKKFLGFGHLGNVIVGIFVGNAHSVVVVVHEEGDGDLAFAFLAANFSGVNALVAFRNRFRDLQNAGVSVFKEFDSIALFQALKTFVIHFVLTVKS